MVSETGLTGIEVTKVFREEGVSGKYMDRKSMGEAIRYLEKENKKLLKYIIL